MCFLNYDQIIEYIGINTDYAPYINSFKETIIEDIIFIDNQCEIQYITKLSVTITSEVEKTTKSCTGINLDNFKLTGFQSTVNLCINGRLEYLDTTNSIGIYSFSLPYIVHIALPENFKTPYTLVSKSYIQHISAKQISEKSFYFNLLTLNTLDF